MKTYFNRWFNKNFPIQTEHEREITIKAWNAAIASVMEHSQYVICNEQEFINFKRTIKSLKYK
jgi:hypothetical protein